MIGHLNHQPNAPQHQSRAGGGLRQNIKVPFEGNKKAGNSASVNISGLSPRESEVLTLLADGLTYNEIANSLHLSVYTVNTYIRRIYEKLQVRSRGKASAAYIQSICGAKFWHKMRKGNNAATTTMTNENHSETGTGSKPDTKRVKTASVGW